LVEIGKRLERSPNEDCAGSFLECVDPRAQSGHDHNTGHNTGGHIVFRTSRRSLMRREMLHIGLLGACLMALLVGASAPAGAQKSSGKVPAATALTPLVKPLSTSSTTPRPLIAEQNYRARVGKLISSLTAKPLIDDDAKAIISILKLIKKRKITEVEVLRNSLKDPVAVKFVAWYSLSVGYGQAQDYVAFLNENPDWPGSNLLRRRFEQALFNGGGSARAILAALKSYPAQRGVGLAAQASAHLALGEKAKASAIARRAWCRSDLPSSFEKGFLARFGGLLRPSDHKCRLDQLLITTLRGKGPRQSRGARIRSLLPLLSKNQRPVATARLSMFLQQRAAKKYLNKLPKGAGKGDAGFIFQRAEYLRRRKQFKAARQVLRTLPADSKNLINRDAWWIMRRRHALEALKTGAAKMAYALISKARPDHVNLAKAQAFFAGRLALKHLRKPKIAINHFSRMLKLADGPLSRSKAGFWLSEAHRRAGNKRLAEKHLKAAALVRDTFHGLLSQQMLDRAGATSASALALPMPAMPTARDVAQFKKSDAVKALVLVSKLRLRRLYALKFLRRLGQRANTEGEFVLLAQLARNLGDGQLEVRAGKMGVARGFRLYVYSYPTDLLPTYKPLRKPVERAFLLSIGRQESEFNTKIISHAGARGILQVMPITARHICRDYKIKCRIKDLISKPAYNVRLASAYIADRMDDFGGSYILTLTGYNAGPGRTRQWLRQLGDPRHKSVEPLDWIYRIPFDETRKYVQKVLSNIQVYRSRLGKRRPVQLVRDMARARVR